MARAKKAKKSSGGRGSAEAIEKRRAARRLNALLLGGSKGPAKLDGRTEKRRRRLIKELTVGRAGKDLKPIDLLQHMHELLEIGESIASLRKQGVKMRRTDSSPEILSEVDRVQSAYGFHKDSWKILGVSLKEEADKAKVIKRPRKKPAKRKARK